MSFASKWLDFDARYLRSSSVALDAGRKEAIEGYVVSPLAHDVLLRIVSSLAQPQGSRSWVLVGPYGSGKSSLCSFLVSLVGDGPAARSALGRWGKQWPAARNVLHKILPSEGPGYAPVIVTGERASLSTGLLTALARAAEAAFPGPGRKPKVLADLYAAAEAAEAGKRIADSRVVEIVMAVGDAVAQRRGGRSGLLIVLDELGKLLEWAASEGARADVYLLQLLAERAARHEGCVVGIIGALHQSFESYAQHLPRSTRLEWAKVEGRFESISFLEAPQHMMRLVRSAVRPSSDARRTPAFIGAAKSAGALAELLPPDLAAAIREGNTFPLQPAAALLAGPLFRLRLGQNERSLFALLGSGEPGSVRTHLNRVASAADLQLFGLPELYDYLAANTSILSASDPIVARVWNSAQEALGRLGDGSGALPERLVKTVALVSCVGAQVGVKADRLFLATALDAREAEIDSCLRDLCGRSILVYRAFKNAYLLWDGSDLDVNELLANARERAIGRGGIANSLQARVPLQPVVASRHAHETGTLRYLLPRFVSPQAEASLAELQGISCDGHLACVLPDRETVLPSRWQVHSDADGKPIVFVVPGDVEEVQDAALDFLATLDVCESTPALENDPVARRELEERRARSEDRLQETLARAYFGSSSGASAVWILRGKASDVSGRPSATASRLFDQSYADCPRIRNELVNRHELSTAAAAARRELMQRMLQHEGEERLGIEGHPPELSVYLSCLAGTGLHRRVGDQWRLVAPEEGHPLFAAWSRIGAALERSEGARVGAGRLLADLQRPPIGLRMGISPIVLLAYYLVNRERIFLYEDGTFVPALAPDLIHRMLRRPETVDLQWAAVDAAVQETLKGVLMRFSRAGAVPNTSSVMSLTRLLVGSVTRLSEFASTTARVSPAARKARSAIRSARDPLKLLLADLPIALGRAPLDATAARSKKDLESYASELSDAILDLRRADEVLEDEVASTVARGLGRAECDAAFLGSLQGRASRLLAQADLPPRVRRLAEICGATDLTTPAGRREWVQAVGVAVIGKPLANWSDEDVPRFKHECHQICRNFVAAEAVSLASSSSTETTWSVVRLDVLDSGGREGSSTVVLSPEDVAKGADLLRAAQTWARESRMSFDAALAVLSRQVLISRAEGESPSAEAAS